MYILRIEHPVPSFDGWKQAFDSDPADRKGSGVRRFTILQAADDPNYVLIDLEFDTREEAQGLLTKMERIWSGDGQRVMRDPKARIVTVASTTDL